MKPIAALLAVLLVTGCQRVIHDATPTAEPTKLDCNLIFPGPGGA